jgi:ABC-2 type transport system ATP-binding protein
VRTYSKGNRQKLGVLLALIARPPVLLLDEPTSGLDPLVQQEVWELLREEAAHGTTVFFSSHVMSEVEHTCTRVGILRAGRLAAVEPVASLTGRALRRLEITFAEPPPAGLFALPGVRELRRERATVWLEATGHLDAVIRALAGYHVLDLRTEQPSLEEILLTFYREEATA